MKRVALAFALMVVGGTASAAIFIPQSDPSLAASATTAWLKSPDPGDSGYMVRSSAPLTIEGMRQPVPFVRLPKPPAPPMAVSVGEPPSNPAFIGTPPRSPSPPPVRSAQAKPAVESEQAVRGLQSRCGGGSMRAIVVRPDGTVDVQC